jgi:hypothetical protein
LLDDDDFPINKKVAENAYFELDSALDGQTTGNYRERPYTASKQPFVLVQHSNSSSFRQKDNKSTDGLDMDLAYDIKPTPSPLSLIQDECNINNNNSNLAYFGMHRKKTDLMSSVTTSNND